MKTRKSAAETAGRDRMPRVLRATRETIKPMPVDRKVMAEHLNEWMKYWDASIRNSAKKQ